MRQAEQTHSRKFRMNMQYLFKQDFGKERDPCVEVYKTTLQFRTGRHARPGPGRFAAICEKNHRIQQAVEGERSLFFSRSMKLPKFRTAFFDRSKTPRRRKNREEEVARMKARAAEQLGVELSSD